MFNILYRLCFLILPEQRQIYRPSGILPSGQNIKTTEIKPMAYVNPYQKGGDKHVFKIRGKPKRRY
ncbi:hypothetical protein ECENVIRA101_2046 [Escherichia coli Envira 10/1]|nr:hypothetical protein ECENVIRA101_2046 [Escherichia coli Envira 10/1]